MDKIEKIYNKCLTRQTDSNDTINPSMILTYKRSPFNLWCDLYAAKEDRDPPSESYKILAEIGNIEEKKFISENYPEMEIIPIQTQEEGFLYTLKGCFEGSLTFSQSPLIYLPEMILGIPDLLIKETTHKSVFGDYHYTIKEKKTVKQIKEEHILQAALNNYIIGKIQNYTPEKFFLINRINEETEYFFSEYETKLANTLREIKEIINGKKVTPTKSQLSEPWKSFGLKKLKESGDISLIYGIGAEKKQLLLEKGIATILDLEKSDINLLKIKGIGEKTLNIYKLQAKALLENKKIILDKPVFQKAKNEIFLDLEGTFDVPITYLESMGIKSNTNEEWTNTVYLIGAIIKEKNSSSKQQFFASTLKEEKKIVNNFYNYLKTKDDFIIYYYGNYEKSTMKKYSKNIS